MLEQTVNQHMSALAQYVANKHRGGGNGQKGASYEDYFAAFLIAKTVGTCLDQDRKISEKIEGQRYGFVDDLYLEEEATQSYFQLKDSPTVSWGKISNNKSISSDFSNQAILAKKVSDKVVATILVCSDQATAKRRNQKIPVGIAAHTRVEHFPCPTNASAEQLLISNQKLRRALAKLSRTACENDISELAATLITIKGIWSSEGNGLHDVSALYSKCLRQNPTVCRTLTNDDELLAKLDPAFKKIMDGIPKLTYSIINGFFNWECGADRGTYPYSCNDRAFSNFQKAIVQLAPTTFDELEEELT